jgi:uncharacterized membrane protein
MVAGGSKEDLALHRPSGWGSVSSRLRLATMLVAGVIVAALVGILGNWSDAPLAGWDVAALTFSAWVWTIIGTADPVTTEAHATREDPGHAQTDIIVLGAAVASLAAVAVVLVQASSAKGVSQDLLAAFGLISIALSWCTVHTLFTLRYARLYYLGRDGGINFNQKSEAPQYLDFAYLAFTIGMTFQVSDTDLQTPKIRATALRHALLSYLFGAIILASTINLISGLATSSSGG